mmetsp:Transcript_48816/g.97835  ORF Transcript_48816/g.97835 Transcript_48816/m.97835 type:complete len:209 (-) Transcript_48816:130-756(-)|eukprot:CAMPEP_0196717502 /NCGR_PEP_ID=MMETSP1091-20130531/861_1 /TAXON_ID=302021 /ORGANISM="Rhodomonas sp., Strain CCMP768" /LENGTH=208 /DNA_ID=CAMNT_0042057849 /DNA_START=27 /DNA_END=653 /DNA_ORIENTATION=-
MQGDQFRPNDEGDQANSGAMSSVALILGCCGLCLVITVLAVYGALVYVVLESQSAGAVACSSEANIWVYCLTMIIVLPILSCLFTVLSTLANAKYLMAIPNVLGAIVAIWGILLWVNMSKQCEAFYTEEFPTLLFLFYVLVILTVASIAAALCSFCCMIVLLAASVSGGSKTPHFDDIPDSAPEQTGYQNSAQDGPIDTGKLVTEEYV